ncbi:MAG: choice-of-anchor Q domain-containing protein, partial [Planctomycetota bacterium]
PANFATIQAAIDAADHADVIVVAPGTYRENIHLKGKAITLTSTEPQCRSIVSATVISAEGTVVKASDASLFGLTIRGTTGVEITGCSPTIRYCRIITSGFAIDAGWGGTSFGIPIIENNLIISGGGFDIDACNCIIMHMKIRNNVIIGNGDQSGHGIELDRGSRTTITGNIIMNFEYGVYASSPSEEEIELITYNNFWNNKTPFGGHTGPFNVPVIQGNIGAYPNFADPAGGDYHLSEGSPCIDAGDPDYVPDPNMTDFEGEPRLMGSRVDIGIDEFTYEHRTLIGLEVSGPEEVRENSSEHYSAWGLYDDGSRVDMTESATWRVGPMGTPGSITGPGILSTQDITTPSVIVVSAEYDNFAGQLPVQIHTPVALEILGPRNVRMNSQAPYRAIAHYEDGEIRDVTNLTLWSCEPEYVATILSYRGSGGRLHTNNLSQSQDITVQADYAGFTEQIPVRVELRTPYTLHVPLEYETIQTAVDLALEGDTIVIAPGIYRGEGNHDIDPQGKAITIRSTAPEDPNIVRSTVIKCHGVRFAPMRGFVFQSGEGRDCVVSGLTITGGYADPGGGIYCSNSSPTIANCVITNCESYYEGGGIYLSRSSPAITNCIISNNISSYSGGGIDCLGSSFHPCNPLITNCTIRDNVARRGGGIHEAGPDSKVINCFIIGNTAIDNGGGGMAECEGQITNCVIAENIATNGYSALEECNGPITNCTIAHNIGKRPIYGSGPITNCILWGNRNVYGTLTAPYGDSVNYSCQQGWTSDFGGTGNVGSHPGFVLEGQWYLSPDSPCIDRGTNAVPEGLPAMDIVGNPRILASRVGGSARVDMGAYEYNRSISALVGPGELVFNVRYGEPNLHEEVLSIANAGGQDLQYEIIEDCPWLEIEPMSGRLTSGSLGQITVTTDPAALSHGEHSCVLTVIDRNRPERTRTITITVKATGTLHISPDTTTIQSAVDAALDGDTILLADGVYKGLGNKEIALGGKAITLRSESGPENCIIDCEDRGQAFAIDSEEPKAIRIEGLTITNGNAEQGGAIYLNDYADPTIVDCVFKENSATLGGAIYRRLAEPNIVNCTFVGNSAAQAGGAIYDYASRKRGGLALIDCSFVGNHSRDGGALYCDRTYSVIKRCTFTMNTADHGGAIYSDGDNPKLLNCIISGNSAIDDGGAVYGYWGLIDLNNCVLTGNRAGIAGGAVRCRGSRATLTSCILWDNEAPTGSQAYLTPKEPSDNSRHSTLHANFCDIQDANDSIVVEEGSTLDWQQSLSIDPCFVRAGYWDAQDTWIDGDYHLLAVSPCINAGDPCNPCEGLVDMDGEPRLMGGCVDIGIDEFSFEPPVLLTIQGPSEVVEESTDKFIALAQYSEGFSQDVTHLANWSVEPEGLAEIAAGRLHTYEMNEPQTVGVHAEYTEGDVTVAGEANVHIPLYVPRTRLVPSEYSTIGGAVDAARDGDTILVDNGVYAGQGNRDINFMGKGLTIRSLNGPANCIIDCNGSEADPHRGFTLVSVEDQASVIEGFTIINGYDDRGGAILCHSSNLTISNCIITDNVSSYRGGAIYCQAAETVIKDCIISRNSAVTYGGAVASEEGELEMVNCILAGNYSEEIGGAVLLRPYGSSGDAISRCTFRENSAGKEGGAILLGSYYDYPGLAVSDCVFAGNEAESGGAMYLLGEGWRIDKCRIAGNKALDSGGGIYMRPPWAPHHKASGSDDGAIDKSEHPQLPVWSIRRSIFEGNRAGNQGGAVRMGNRNGDLVNCTFYGNLAPEGSALLLTPDSTPYWEGSVRMLNCIFWDGENQIWNAPSPDWYGHEIRGVISHSNIGGGRANVHDPHGSIIWGVGNLEVEPMFAGAGYRDANSSPEDPNDDFWIEGDYHLMSEGWRWDAGRDAWTWDDVTSRCIDAGLPASGLGAEPLFVPGDPESEFGRNVRVNMGAYGATEEASIAPHGWAVRTDYNNDGLNNFVDMALFFGAFEHFALDPCTPGARDVGGVSIIAEAWLDQTAWCVFPPVVPGRSHSPSPPTGMVDVPTVVTLTWQPAERSDSYDVYFGMEAPGAFQARQTETAFNPG